MSDEQFHEIAFKALAPGASAGDKAALENALALEPSRQADVEELRTALTVAQAALPLASALDAKDAELPRYRMGELRSAVRAHFHPRHANQPEKETSGWMERLWSRLALGSGLMATAVVLIFALMPAPSVIEVGFYAEPLTRGTDSTPIVQSASNVRVNQFETDPAFAQWLAKPFAKDEKARVWLDEEHDLIHVRLRGNWLRGASEFTRPLPDDAAERQAAIGSLLHSLEK